MSKHENENEKRQNWLAFINSLNLDIDADSFRLMHEMRMVSHAIKQLGESSLAAADLSLAQYRVLMNLLMAKNVRGHDELNPSEISDHLGVSRNTISSLIRSLEEKGLIQRKLDSSDRRKFNISLTTAGADMVTQHAGNHMRTVSNCFEILNSGERHHFSQYLHKLGSQIESVRASTVGRK